jgi:hypothetical protein
LEKGDGPPKTLKTLTNHVFGVFGILKGAELARLFSKSPLSGVQGWSPCQIFFIIAPFYPDYVGIL